MVVSPFNPSLLLVITGLQMQAVSIAAPTAPVILNPYDTSRSILNGHTIRAFNSTHALLSTQSAPGGIRLVDHGNPANVRLVATAPGGTCV